MYGYIPAGARKNNLKKNRQKKTNYIPGEPKETNKVILKKKKWSTSHCPTCSAQSPHGVQVFHAD